jgi:dihydrolipoamide dehydrogenase
MSNLICDVAIIGAGTAGLAAERAARQAGAKTLLIDDRFAGTTCASVGCMPSKLLIAAANAAYNIKRSAVFGVHTNDSQVDGQAVMARVRKERDAFVAATLQAIRELPSGVCIQQTARFFNETTLALKDGRTISAKSVVIATGARPSVPKLFANLGSLLQTNETIFELPSLPRSMAVIGAGPLGLELAQAFARLGVDIELFEQTDHIGGLKDDEVAQVLKSVLRKEFPMHFNAKLEAVSDAGLARVRWSGESTGAKSFERVLVATGRPPALDLDSTGISFDDRGAPKVDEATLQCGDAPIFLAGDAAGSRPVVHEASADGYIAGRNAAAFPNVQKGHRFVPLSLIFLDPPVAVVGAPSTDRSIVGTATFADQGRAKIEDRNTGLIRLYADRDSRLSGATLMGPAMDHIAHLLAWAIERKQTIGDMLTLPFYHPTLEEGLKPALRQICEAVKAPELEWLGDLPPPGA